MLDCLKQGQDVSQFFPGADRGNYLAAGLIRIAAQSFVPGSSHHFCSDSPASGSTDRSEVTKLDGNSPTPLWFSPFHQLASLGK